MYPGVLDSESPCSTRTTRSGTLVDTIKEEAQMEEPGISHWIIPMVGQHEQMFGGRNMQVDSRSSRKPTSQGGHSSNSTLRPRDPSPSISREHRHPKRSRPKATQHLGEKTRVRTQVSHLLTSFPAAPSSSHTVPCCV